MRYYKGVRVTTGPEAARHLECVKVALMTIKQKRAAREKAEREAAWEAEQARVKALGDLFTDLPEGHQKAALLDAMTGRIIHLYNECKHEQGDAILEFLPTDVARRLLDWYFDEDGPDVAPDFRRPDERCSAASPAGQSVGAQTEAAPDAGPSQAAVKGEASTDQASSCDAGRRADQTPGEGKSLLAK